MYISEFRFCGYWSNYFDNVGDYITMPDDNSLRLGTEAFTIEAWIYHHGVHLMQMTLEHQAQLA